MSAEKDWVPDELDRRIRSLDAERVRPVPKAPARAQKDALEARASQLLNHIRQEYGPLHGESYPQEIEPDDPQAPERTVEATEDPSSVLAKEDGWDSTGSG